MGQYFLIVNKDKKQFLDAWKFGEGVETLQAVSGYHAQAVALLTCRMEDVRDTNNNLLGSWSGDFVAAVGEYASPKRRGTIFTKPPATNLKTSVTKLWRCSATRTNPFVGNSPKKPRIRDTKNSFIISETRLTKPAARRSNRRFIEVIGSEWRESYQAAAEYYAALA